VDWLHHPSYAHFRDGLIERLKRPSYTFKNLRNVIFLCGSANSAPRDALAAYLRKYHPNKLVFYAEEVWSHMAKNSASSALEMENRLAELADIVIIIVNSPGTFAELGAFSLNDRLRRKLLPILDVDHRDAPSFINTGPVRSVDTDSAYRPTIYTKLPAILGAIDEIESRLRRIPHRYRESVQDLASSPKHILFLLSDLVTIIGPVPVSHLSYYLERILGRPPSCDIETLLGLCVSLKMLAYYEVGAVRRYYRPLQGDRLIPFQHKKMFDLSEERAKFLSVLQNIPEARQILEAIEPVYAS